MPLFSLCIHDRAGRMMNENSVEAADVYGALAKANAGLRRAVRRRGGAGYDTRGHIDVRADGSTVARLVCAEAIVALS